ncbi:MAG: hypothetical protein IKE69_11065 [Thermoguttaceae bacterium]|nr:hypothetical protein [Thermoguttaceae bacterium]
MKNDGKSSTQTQTYLASLWKEYQDRFESEDEFLRTVAVWPVCPECGRRREVGCPVCHRAGDLFPPADDEFWFSSEETATADQTPASFCGCGNDICRGDGPHSVNGSDLSQEGTLLEPSKLISTDCVGSATDFAASEEAADHETVWQFSEPEADSVPGWGSEAASDSIYTARTFSVSTPNYHRSTMQTLDMTPEKKRLPEDFSQKFQKAGLRLVKCPTCDEPFVPKYLPVCIGCGHRFDSSSDSPETMNFSDTGESTLEADGGRIALIAFGMVIVAILFVLFILFL